MSIPFEPHPLASNGGLLDPKAAAVFLGISPWTLAEWRVAGEGPRFIKLGRLVRYAPSDLQIWLDANARYSTSQGGGAA